MSADRRSAAVRDRHPRRALVVFRDTPARPWQRLLRRGFRHCFVLLPLSCGWLFVDPRLATTDVGLMTVPRGFDVAAWYLRRGCTVLWVERTMARRPFPWRPFTCVEAVKRVLGLDAPWVLTPWQLYRILRKNKILDIQLDQDYLPLRHRGQVRPDSTAPGDLLTFSPTHCANGRNPMGSFSPAPEPSPPPPPPEPAPDPEEERRTARLDMLRRRRRGREGTIATSPRGLLRLRDEPPAGGKLHLGD